MSHAYSGSNYHSNTHEYTENSLKKSQKPKYDTPGKPGVSSDSANHSHRPDNTEKVGDNRNENDKSDKNDGGGFGARNQFDRASQLRRSRKKRKKSDIAGNTSSNDTMNKNETLRDQVEMKTGSVHFML